MSKTVQQSELHLGLLLKEIYEEKDVQDSNCWRNLCH